MQRRTGDRMSGDASARDPTMYDSSQVGGDPLEKEGAGESLYKTRRKCVRGFVAFKIRLAGGGREGEGGEGQSRRRAHPGRGLPRCC